MGKGKTPSRPAYAATTTTNPYAAAESGKKGSSYTLNPFLASQNQYVEANLPGLYNQLLNPNLNNPVTRARQNIFNQQFLSNSQKAFENNINNLAVRGLARSSTVNDLANNLAAHQAGELANFSNQLIANNINDTNSLINTLLNQYMLGATLGEQALASAKGDTRNVNSFNQAMASFNNKNNSSNPFAAALSALSGSGGMDMNQFFGSGSGDLLNMAMKVAPLFLV